MSARKEFEVAFDIKFLNQPLQTSSLLIQHILIVLFLSIDCLLTDCLLYKLIAYLSTIK